MPRPPLIIKTNVAHPTEVRILGTVLSASGGSVTFEEIEEIEEAQNSQPLRTYLEDDAYGADSSTLILANAAGDIPQSNAISYLNSPNYAIQNWFGGWG